MFTMEQSSLLMSARVHFLVSLPCFKVSREISDFPRPMKSPYGAGMDRESQKCHEVDADLSYQTGSTAEPHPYPLGPVPALSAFNTSTFVPIGGGF